MGRQRRLYPSYFGSLSIPTSATLCQPSPCSEFRALKCSMVLERGAGRGQGAGQSRSPAPAQRVAGRSSPEVLFASPSLCCLGHSRLCLDKCPSLQIPKQTKCYYHIIIVSLMCSAQKDSHRAKWTVSGYSKWEIRCHFPQLSFYIFSCQLELFFSSFKHPSATLTALHHCNACSASSLRTPLSPCFS